MSIILALGAAGFIGSADFIGGWLSRQGVQPTMVTLAFSATALVVVGTTALILRPHLTTEEVLLAGAGGCASVVAITLVYAAFAAGAISLIAPLIACGTSIVPTVAASIRGQVPDPVQFGGIALALVAVVVITASPAGIASHEPLTRRALLLTGAAALIGGTAVALAQAAANGTAVEALGVATISRLVGCSLVGCLFLIRRVRPTAPRRLLPAILLGGFLEGTGVAQELIGTTLGNPGVVAVVTSLYAVVTVMLAQLIFRERLLPRQAVGIFIAAAGVALLSTG